MPQLSLRHQSLDLSKLGDYKNDAGIMIDLFLGTHVQWKQHQETAHKAHQLLAAADLNCGVIHSDLAIDDIDTIVQAVEIAHALNAEFITVASPEYTGDTPYRALLAAMRGCFQDLNQISSETGIDALLQIDANSICPNVDAAMRILEGLDPSQVGVLYDLDNQVTNNELQRSLDVLGPFLRVIRTDAADRSLLTKCLDYLDEDQVPLISIAADNIGDLKSLAL